MNVNEWLAEYVFTDHSSHWKLHEQCQEGGCVWIQVTELGYGEQDLITLYFKTNVSNELHVDV